jgi:hypothetical protein
MGVSGRRGWLLDRLDNTVVMIVFGILGLDPHVTDDAAMCYRIQYDSWYFGET